MSDLTKDDLTERLYLVRGQRNELLWACEALLRLPVMDHVHLMLPESRAAYEGIAAAVAKVRTAPGDVTS